VAAAHISKVNCAEITRDRAVQPAYEIFSIKRTSYRSFDLIGSRSVPYRGLKCVYFKAHYYFTACCIYVAGLMLSRVMSLLKLLFKYRELLSATHLRESFHVH